jgi:hypothetical protein
MALLSSLHQWGTTAKLNIRAGTDQKVSNIKETSTTG